MVATYYTLWLGPIKISKYSSGRLLQTVMYERLESWPCLSWYNHFQKGIYTEDCKVLDKQLALF